MTDQTGAEREWRLSERGSLSVLFEGRWESSTTQWTAPDQHKNAELRKVVAKAVKEIEALESRLRTAEAALRTYGSHLGNCLLESWDEDMTSCTCGLFQLLAAAALTQEEAT